MRMPTIHKHRRHVRHIVASMQAFAQRKNLERGSCNMLPQLMSGHLVILLPFFLVGLVFNEKATQQSPCLPTARAPESRFLSSTVAITIAAFQPKAAPIIRVRFHAIATA